MIGGMFFLVIRLNYLNGVSMKNKLALFLFALGLGSSLSYAMPSGGYGCNSLCMKEYNACIAKTGNNKAACTLEKNACLASCNTN